MLQRVYCAARPLDWFDLLLHTAPWMLLLAKLARVWYQRISLT